MSFTKTDKNLYVVDNEPHIKITDQEICNKCPSRACLTCCPCKCYTISETTKSVEFSHLGCLECGTCRIVCSEGAIFWSYPRGGHGILYRY